MFCATCGAQIDGSGGFCSSCGASVAAGASNAASTETSSGLVIGAIACSVLALIFLPPISGGVGIYLGSRVHKTNEGLGTNLMILAGVCLVLGMLFGALLFLSV